MAAGWPGARAETPLEPLSRVGRSGLDELGPRFTHARPPASRGRRIYPERYARKAATVPKNLKLELRAETLLLSCRGKSNMECDISLNLLLKVRSKIFIISSKIDPKMVPNSWKIDLWSCLGALWAPSWRQDGPRATPRAKFYEKYAILGWAVGSQMEPKSMKNLLGNRPDFYIDFETTFSWSWHDFGSKNLSQIRGLRVTFSILLRICEKCDLEQSSHRFAIFFNFESIDFRS